MHPTVTLKMFKPSRRMMAQPNEEHRVYLGALHNMLITSRIRRWCGSFIRRLFFGPKIRRRQANASHSPKQERLVGRRTLGDSQVGALWRGE
ncbi:hypothetical protein JHW43_000533 [Diplocarpon mali]|nr:hypothetical protein JHW43_000533 [Diplocarpon mali]